MSERTQIPGSVVSGEAFNWRKIIFAPAAILDHLGMRLPEGIGGLYAGMVLSAAVWLAIGFAAWHFMRKRR